MSTEIPEIEPTTVEAGTTVKWTKDLSADYPADDGWTLAYTFINAAAKFSVSAAASGKKFSITITATTTAGYTSGIYQWIARVTKGAEVYTVDSGHCEVTTNIAAAGTTTFDHRSHVKTVLDAIEAVLENRATQDQMGYTIAGRSLERTPIPDLLGLRDRYKAEYQRELDAERIDNGLGSRKVKVRFL